MMSPSLFAKRPAGNCWLQPEICEASVRQGAATKSPNTASASVEHCCVSNSPSIEADGLQRAIAAIVIAQRGQPALARQFKVRLCQRRGAVSSRTSKSSRKRRYAGVKSSQPRIISGKPWISITCPGSISDREAFETRVRAVIRMPGSMPVRRMVLRPSRRWRPGCLRHSSARSGALQWRMKWYG